MLISTSCWQGVQHFKDIQYTASMTYGELFMQNEYEMSCYNLDEANVEGQRQRFELYQQVCCHNFCCIYIARSSPFLQACCQSVY